MSCFRLRVFHNFLWLRHCRRPREILDPGRSGWPPGTSDPGMPGRPQGPGRSLGGGGTRGVSRTGEETGGSRTFGRRGPESAGRPGEGGGPPKFYDPYRRSSLVPLQTSSLRGVGVTIFDRGRRSWGGMACSLELRGVAATCGELPQLAGSCRNYPGLGGVLLENGDRRGGPIN